MGKKMKDRCTPGTQSQCQEHITDLADRGIGQYSFDIGLHHGAATGNE